MTEPYFEERSWDAGSERFPFSCFISDSHGRMFRINPHWHYYIEMLYSIEGQAQVVLAGKRHTFNQGDMALISAREVHSIYVEQGRDTRYIVVKFSPEVLYTTTRTIFESKYVLPFTIARSSYPRIFRKEDIDNTPIPSLMREIFDECTSKNHGFELAVRANICRIFLWFLRDWNKKGLNFDIGSTVKELNINKMQEVVDYLDSHYCDALTTEFVAAMCHMSYGYFCRQFKDIMGKTFIEYLNYIRVTEAEKLLLTTDLNVTQIALNTGFSSTSYFIKQFRHFESMSPIQFRKKVISSE